MSVVSTPLLLQTSRAYLRYSAGGGGAGERSEGEDAARRDQVTPLARILSGDWVRRKVGQQQQQLVSLSVTRQT